MKKSLKKNIVYQMLYEALVLILPLATSPYVSRVLGADGVGVFSYTYSITTYFGLFVMLGIKNYGNREIAKCSDDIEQRSATFWSIYCIQLISSFLTICAYFVYVYFWGNDYRFIYLINFIYIISCVFDIEWFYCGIELFKLTVFKSSFVKIVSFISVFLFVKDSGDVWKYCLIMSLSSMLSQSLLWFNIRKYISKFDKKMLNIRNCIKPILLLFIPVVAVSLYNIMDKIMLGAICNKNELGYYENSEKLIFCIRTIITSFGVVMLPRMSNLAASGDKAKSEKYIRLSLEIVMLISACMTFGIAAVAKDFSIVFWGADFEKCGFILIGLSLSIPFTSFANVIRTQYLIPNNRDREYIISVIAGALVNFIVNLLLISKYQSIGAVIGTVVAEIVVCCIQCIYIRNDLEIKKYIMNAIPYYIIGFVMYIIVTNMSSGNASILFGLFFKILIGIISAFFLLAAYIFTLKKDLLHELNIGTGR